MIRIEFMKELEQSLSQLPAAEREDIVADFEEHFEVGLADGKGEDEIAASLGSPSQIAKEMVADYHLGTAGQHVTPRNVLKATWAVIGLSFFNLIIVLGPFMALVGVIIAGWAVSGSFIISPLLALIDLIVIDGNSFFNLFSSFALCGIGLLIGLLMHRLTKWLSNSFIRYLNYNASLVKGGIRHEKN